MKVIFLDFDGVLNSRQSQIMYNRKRNTEEFAKQDMGLFEALACEFCPIALSNLEHLIELVPEAKIVISSTWRKGNDLDRMKGLFVNYPEIANRIIGMTPTQTEQMLNNQEWCRGDEIAHWLGEKDFFIEYEEVSDPVTSYVILDDDRDMIGEQKKRHIRTSPLHGLQYGDILMAKDILLKEF